MSEHVEDIRNRAMVFVFHERCGVRPKWHFGCAGPGSLMLAGKQEASGKCPGLCYFLFRGENIAT